MLPTNHYAAVKADILAQGDLSVLPNTPDGNSAISDLYNAVASPQFFVWRTRIASREIQTAVDWSEYIARSQGERDAFGLLTQSETVDGSDANVRAGFSDIFSGPGGAVTRPALLAVARRDATRIEAVLVSSGVGSSGDPGTMAFEGKVTHQDIMNARNS